MFTSAGNDKQPYLGALGLCLCLGQAIPAGGMFQIFLRELRLHAAWTGFQRANWTGFHRANRTGFQRANRTGFQRANWTGFQRANWTGFQRANWTGFQRANWTGFQRAKRRCCSTLGAAPARFCWVCQPVQATSGVAVTRAGAGWFWAFVTRLLYSFTGGVKSLKSRMACGSGCCSPQADSRTQCPVKERVCASVALMCASP